MTVFLRVMQKTPDVWLTYPLTAFDHISHSRRHQVYIAIGGQVYSVVECTSHKECIAVEDAILCNIGGPWGSDLRIIDVSMIAERALTAYRSPPEDEDPCVGCPGVEGGCQEHPAECGVSCGHWRRV